MAANEWRNVVSMFFDQAEKFADKPFLSCRRGDAWQSMSWGETAIRIAQAAEALRKLGIKPGDRVAIVSENRPEWLIADFAIMALGAISVPAYTTYTERDYLHVLNNSGARAVIVGAAKLAAQVLPAAHLAPQVKFALCIEQPPLRQSLNCALHDWTKALDAEPGDVGAWRGAAEGFPRDQLACLIYTSGTGGAPRGVKQHHGGLLHNCAGAYAVLAEADDGKTDIFLSFLPLSHAYEHTGGQMLPIYSGAQIYYSQGLDKLAAEIEQIRPTIMIVVPRLFEVLRTRISRALEKQGPRRAALFARAQALGAKRIETPHRLNLLERIEDRLLDLVVRRKVRRKFGGRIKALVSGGAPLNPEVGMFFLSLGLRIIQGYGQTEAHPVISVHRLFDIKIDTIGKPLDNTEVKLAEDGELLVRGELVMQGYWQDDEATAQVLKDGWLHTGDIGVFTPQGHLKITDRKKDIIVNDKGENVAPQKVEGMLSLAPEIIQAMVDGDRRPYLVALLVPDQDWLRDWCAKHGKTGLAAIKDDPDLRGAIGVAVDRINRQLASVERVRRFAILAEPFTVENGQMTPTLKIRRHMIRAAYQQNIDALYAAKED